MSNHVFPPSTITPKLAWSNTKAPAFSTVTQTTKSGREARAGDWVYPRWAFTWTYHVIDNSPAELELRAILGFFLSRGGSAESFLIQDTEDYAVTAQGVAVGDDATRAFQLVRAYGGYVEPVWAPQLATPTPAIYLDGALQSSGYTLDATGALTFTSAPGAGVLIAWTGQFYYRVRFVQDTAEVEEFMVNLWRYQKIELVGLRDDA